MAIKVPLFKDPNVTEFLVRAFTELERRQERFMLNNTGNHSVLLLSPSKKVYEITVDDAGVISSTLVQG